MNLQRILEKIDNLKSTLDSLRPIPVDRLNRIMHKLRLDWNYHSNSIEGNTLTLTETRALILFGITAKGKPMRDHLEMRGHNEALQKLEEIAQQQLKITERIIQEFHKIIMVEPSKGKSEINPGKYKELPNYLYSPEGERIDFDSPEVVPEKMNELINWLNNQLNPPKRKRDKYDLHPLVVACLFHLRFIKIHPFGDGNGRMARILMNLILMQKGYVPAIIRLENKTEYYRALNTSTEQDPFPLIEFVANELTRSLEIAIDGAKGKDIEEDGDFIKEVEVLQRMQNPPKKKVEKSLEVMKGVLNQVYFPLLNELDIKLSALNVLFEKHSWTYFEEPMAPDYKTPLHPNFSNLNQMINYFQFIPDKKGDSSHNYKASYWLLKYNDETDFSMEVALRLYFYDYTYEIEVFIGQPFQSSRMVQLFAKLIDTLNKTKGNDLDINTPYNQYAHFNFPEKEYGTPVIIEEIKDWAKEIGKQTIETLKKKAIGKIE